MYVSFQNIEKLSSSPLILYENISIMSTIHQCKFTLALYLKIFLKIIFYILSSIY